MWKIHSKDINHIIKNDNFHHWGLRKIDLKFLRSRSRSRSIFCKFTYSELVHAKDQVQRGWSWSFAVKITDLTQLWERPLSTFGIDNRKMFPLLELHKDRVDNGERQLGGFEALRGLALIFQSRSRRLLSMCTSLSLPFFLALNFFTPEKKVLGDFLKKCQRNWIGR